MLLVVGASGLLGYPLAPAAPAKDLPPSVVFEAAGAERWYGAADLDTPVCRWMLKDAGGGIGGYSMGWDSDPGLLKPGFAGGTRGWLSFASLPEDLRKGKHVAYVRAWNRGGTRSQLYTSSWYGLESGPDSCAIDSPRTTLLTGTVEFTGWVRLEAREPAVRKVQLLLDGQDMGPVTYPIQRSDGKPGFTLKWNSAAAAPGRHWLLLRVTDKANISWDVEQQAVQVARGYRLVKARDWITVYLVINGVRRAFTSPECFRDWGFEFPKVEKVDWSTISQYRWGPPIAYLIQKADDPEIDWVDLPVRRHILDLKFKDFDDLDVIKVSAERFSRFSQGSDIAGPQPRLLIIDGPYLSPATGIHVGDPVTVTYRARNLGTAASVLRSIFFTARGPDGNYHDFPETSEGEVQPGSELSYSAQTTFTLAGHYDCYCTFTTPDKQSRHAENGGFAAYALNDFTVLPAAVPGGGK